MKAPFFIPNSKHIDELFNELKKKKTLIAIVIDEYGGTCGLVTMEDIIEEIVGEIYDEYDDDFEQIKKISDNEYIVNGDMNINDVNELLNIHIEDGEYETISGFIMDKIAEIPSKQDLNRLIETEDAIYKIESVEGKCITKIRINIIKNNNNE